MALLKIRRKSEPSRIHLVPAIILMAGIMGSLLTSRIAENDYWGFYGLILMVSFAAALCGVFLGLIFGVPRLNDKFKPTDDYDSVNKYMPNTNLEDMSDWLTKIIVGVSLTQLASFPGYFVGLADYVLKDAKCIDDCNYAHAVVISTVIYFLITGFLIGYMYTRLYLPRLLTLMEDKEKVVREKEEQKEEAKIWKENYKRTKGTGRNKTISQSWSLSSFTDPELEILRIIAAANNRYTPTKILQFEAYAAVKVLLGKDVIEMVDGGDFRIGGTMSMKDTDLLDLILKEGKDPNEGPLEV